MLTGEPAFEGKTPLEVMQNVLSRRIPSVTSKRPDVPDALAAVLTKMTQKNIDDRYSSTSGLKYDLLQIRRIIEQANGEDWNSFSIGSKDNQSNFNLPSSLLGREKECSTILSVIDKVARRRYQPLGTASSYLKPLTGSASTASDPRLDYRHRIEDPISDTASSTASESRLNSTSRPTLEALKTPRESQESVLSPEPVLEGVNHPSLDMKTSPERRGHAGLNSYNTRSSTRSSSVQDLSGDNPSILLRNAKKLSRNNRCEVISISGSAGLGKSTLVQSMAGVARSHGYFAVAKFDQAKRAPFDGASRLLSSILRVIFSESNVDTPFHDTLRAVLRPLKGSKNLPEWLFASSNNPLRASHKGEFR